MPTLHLRRSLVNEILRRAQHSPDNEVCGLISERNGQAVRVYPIANVAEEPANLFRMDGKGQIDAMRSMRENGEALLAIYHSHPRSPAEPSARDLEEAAYPEAVYLIISLGTKGVLEMRGYRLGAGAVEPVELEIA